MSLHANPRERLLETTAADLAAAPAAGTAPHFVISPLAANGEPAVGIVLSLIAPTTVTAMAPTATTFTVTPWILNPVLGSWVAGTAIAGVAFSTAYVLHDLPGGSHTYFQVTGSTGTGSGILAMAELSA